MAEGRGGRSREALRPPAGSHVDFCDLMPKRSQTVIIAATSGKMAVSPIGRKTESTEQQISKEPTNESHQ
jgi:hypothetical protein